MNKLPDFQRTILECRPHPSDVVAVTETWLTDRLPDGIMFPEYSLLFRTDRDDNGRGSRGGGVLLLVRDGLRCQHRPELKIWDESVWIEIFFRGIARLS